MTNEQLMSAAKFTFNALAGVARVGFSVLRVTGKVFAWMFSIIAVMAVLMTSMW